MLTLAMIPAARAQTPISLGSYGTQQSQSTTAVTSRTLVGQVINAATGTPIARALVSINSRSILTDARGNFTFADFTDAQAYAGVQKPGFAQDPEQGEGPRMVKLASLDLPVELKLYPDALIRGTITGPDGFPLARTQVRLRRLTFDITGPRWNNVGFTITDGRGEYRFREPAGRYRVTTGYTQRSQETGDAVLPVSYPPVTATITNDFFDLTGGEERIVDLHPRTGPTHPVALTVDGDDPTGGLRLTVTGASGVSFPAAFRRAEEGPSQLNLPTGTYTIRAVREGRDEAVEGSTRVSVTSTGQARAILHLSPMAQYPVQASFETASASSGTAQQATPSIRQLNLYFQNVANDGEQDTGDVRLSGAQSQAASFNLRPGRYRLIGQRNNWYVRSASAGGVDLLAEELLVAPGSPGVPIQLVVSNVTGVLRGSVTSGGLPSPGWLYLVARTPSATPYYELILQPDGTFYWLGPPGAYTAVVVDHQIHENLRDPDYLRGFLSAGTAVTITAGGESSVTLTLDPGAKR